eukprot:scaffold1559_cov176-Ochromonas_danica.AAC.9
MTDSSSESDSAGRANILSYFALARLDAALYAVLAQLKILTTASFSVCLLHRSFSWTKWRALFLLVLSCILVASPALHASSDSSKHVDWMAFLSGVAAVLGLVSVSGYSAVYFESMLKAEKITIWERNFQLAFYSFILLGMISVCEGVYSPISQPMFANWSINASLLAAISAAGGLLVAATLKYADSVLKTLATSGSIVLSAILGYLLLGADLDLFVGLGCAATILAICNYTFEESAAPPEKTISSAVHSTHSKETLLPMTVK